MTAKELREVVDTYTELLRVYQLNTELLDTLELTLYSVKDFCIAHNIPFGNDKISSLLSKINALLSEMDLTDDSLHGHKKDDKFTEP